MVLRCVALTIRRRSSSGAQRFRGVRIGLCCPGVLLCLLFAFAFCVVFLVQCAVRVVAKLEDSDEGRFGAVEGDKPDPEVLVETNIENAAVLIECCRTLVGAEAG